MQKAYEVTPSNPLAGKRLRYLIGAAIYPVNWQGVIEVGYDDGYPSSILSSSPPVIAYCNLFDEKNSGKYGPYLHESDTASQYHEGQIDPKGAGWLRNLYDQCMRRKSQDFQYIELDNPDAYHVSAVLQAYSYAATFGFKVIAKNPGICEDGNAMLAHSSVVGVIVEMGCGSPSIMDDMRKRASKPDLPVWFVCFGSGKSWGKKTAATIANNPDVFKNMYVTYSSEGEYGNAIDL